MDDKRIIELYLERSENAIEETRSKYGRYCHTVAYNILESNEDAEECVNDTYLKAWNSIPPTIPQRLSAFLARITRNIALQRYEYYTAKKRGGGIDVMLFELADAIPYSEENAVPVTDEALAKHLNKFLASLSKKNRVIFMSRYWYAMPIKQIADEMDMSEGAVKVSLLRTRNKLKSYLEGKGISL